MAGRTFNSILIDIKQKEGMADIVARIQDQVDEAVALESDSFKVHRSTGLKAMLKGQTQTLAKQPQQCHMQFFRQVLSPLGLYNCPVYRNQDHGRLGDKNANAGVQSYDETRAVTADLIRSFNATTECEKVTCLYNDVNWWIEKLIQNPDELAKLKTDTDSDADYFL